MVSRKIPNMLVGRLYTYLICKYGVGKANISNLPTNYYLHLTYILPTHM